MKLNKIFTILVMVCLFLITVKGALGAVVINEIMQNPDAVTDGNGEYIELYNTGPGSVDLEGWTIKDAGVNTHTINNGALNILANNYLVLCRNSNTANNGGVTCDYNYSNFGLGNGADEVILLDAALVEVDRVEYDGGPDFPDPLGASMELKDPFLDNNDGANWVEAYRTLTAGDLGSPGQDNNDAPNVGNIPNRARDEGSIFPTFDLDNRLTEVDGDSITWSYSGNTDLLVSIDPNNVVIVIIPNVDWFGAETITFTATDNNAAALSDSDPATYTINPVNDVPVIVAPIPHQEASEGIESSYTIQATDVDNPQADLYIDPVNSILPNWLSIDPNNPMALIGAPDLTHLGVLHQAVIFVSDGVGSSLPGVMIFNIIPALQIQESSIEIEIDGTTYTALDQLDITPGDQVKVKFSFQNNFDHNLGHVGTQAYANINLIDMPHQGLCAGVDCDQGYWSLDPQEVGQDEFTFTVPYDISANVFTLTLEAYHDGQWPGISSADDYHLTFNTVREDSHLVITDSSLFDENLTCVRTAFLDLDITNAGNFNLAPEVLIYDQQPIESSFDKNEGEFTSFTSTPNLFVEETLNTINAGTTVTETILVDTINLSYGQHTLYVYLVNPYFNSNEYYIGDKIQVNINIAGCLDLAALEELFTLSKGSLNSVSADLNDYTDEDALYNLQFSVADQSDPTIVDCAMAGFSQLVCTPQSNDESGSSDITISIDEASTLTPVEESFIARVISVLEISNVRVNNVPVGYLDTIGPIKPGDPFQIDFTLTNYLDHAITGLTTQFLSPGLKYTTDSGNLAGSSSTTITLNENLPYDAVQGNYPVEIFVQGTDFADNTIVQSDSFQYLWDVVQDPAAVHITNLSLEDQAITCKPYTSLIVELTNMGSNNENDVILKLTGGNVDLTTGPLSLPANGGQLDHKFIIYAADLVTGTNTLTVEVTYRDGFMQEIQTIALDKGSCLSSYSPTEDPLVVADGASVDFSVELAEQGYEDTVDWFVDDNSVATGQTAYTYLGSIPGEYQVKVSVNANEEETHTWTVIVTAVPLSDNFQTNVPLDATDAELANFENFTIQNQYGKIVYNEPVDLRNIADLDALVIIEEGLVAVDTTAAPELNKDATVTFFRSFSDPVILNSDGFNAGDFTECSTCTLIENNAANGFVFTVTGFKTYSVVEKEPSDFEISEILIEDLDRGENGSTTFTIRNTGTYDSLTALTVDLDVDSDYQAQLVGSIPATLAPGEEFTLTLELTVPLDEDSGQHSIGSLTATGNAGNDTVTSSKTVYLNPKSNLIIENVEINGKSSGDFSPEEDTNEIEVEVRNEYTEDMEDVLVTVEILDVDGDDLEEEADEQDINDGDDEKFTVEFDLSNEKLDEDSYTVEITVEGEATDGSKHEATKTIEVDVERESHKVVIRRAALSPDLVQCSRYASVEIKIENVGQRDEDDIEVRISNSALGLDERKTGIELEDYSSNDNDETVRFYLQNYLETAPAGNYPIEVELYRDDDLEEDTTVDLEVKDCTTTQTTTQTQDQMAQDDLAQLQYEIQQQLQTATPPGQEVTAVKSTFRNTTTYFALLGVIVFLLLVLSVLGFIAILKKR